ELPRGPRHAAAVVAGGGGRHRRRPPSRPQPGDGVRGAEALERAGAGALPLVLEPPLAQAELGGQAREPDERRRPVPRHLAVEGQRVLGRVGQQVGRHLGPMERVRGEASAGRRRRHAVQDTPELRYRESLLAHEFAEVNGVRLHYATAGRGPLILFLHGFPEFWYAWRKQLGEFARDHQAAAPDMRGYNLSGKPPAVEEYRMSRLAEDVRALAAHLGHRRFTLVGH